MGLTRTGPQPVRVRQPLVLGAQLQILTRQRVDRLDLFKACPEHIHLSRPVASQLTQAGQLGAHLVEIVVESGVTRQRLGHRRAGETVQHDEMLLRLTQPPLIGLTMNGHEQLAQLAQHADRNGPSADMRLGPAPRRHGSHKDEAVLHVAAGLDGPQGREVVLPHLDHALHDSGRGARPDQGCIRPGSEQQPESRDDHGLACTRLAG